MTLHLFKLLALSIVLLFYRVSAQDQIIVGAQEPMIEQISDTLELPGSVLANESVKITSVVSEKIDKILFEEGMFVKKNQLFLKDELNLVLFPFLQKLLPDANYLVYLLFL